MHNCPPPKRALHAWLNAKPSVEGIYGHLLLEQKTGKDEAPIEALQPYFESAHLDARKYFHDIMRIELHPDADGPAAHASYPNCLPKIAKHGLFGEVMAGLLTEAFAFVGGHKWEVPVFLFRYHLDVEQYLFSLSRNPDKRREVFGRPGSDFLALRLDEDGGVVRFIAGEAKWRNSLTQGVADVLLLGKKVDDPEGGADKVHDGKGIWFELNQDTPVPHGVTQLQRLLYELAPDDYAETIVSLDKALALGNPDAIPRTDLVLLAGNGGRMRSKNDRLVDWEEPPVEYTAGNDLQVVELILAGGEQLIEQLYASLWAKEAADAEA